MPTSQSSEINVRPTVWFNTHTHDATYGIEILIRGMWIPMGDEEGFFLFDTKNERDMAMEKHRAALNA